MRLESEKHDYVPSPAPDYTVSILDRLFDLLGWLTGVKVPVPMSAGRDTCWHTVQLEKAAAFEFIDCGVSGFGTMIRSTGGVKVRSTNCPTILSWSSCALFTVLLLWIWLIGLWDAIARLTLYVRG